MLFQYLCGFKPIFYPTHPDEEPYFGSLFNDYYGEDFVVTEGRKASWMHIPHYFNNYYVYKYATSATYAGIISNRIKAGDKDIVANYREFLTKGASAKPSELLKGLDIDPTDETVYSEFEEYYKSLIDGYEELVNSMEE